MRQQISEAHFYRATKESSQMDERAEIRAKLIALLTAPDDALTMAAEAVIAKDAVWDIAHPVNRLEGRAAIVEGIVRPLRRAFQPLRRRDEIFMGGANRREQGGTWMAAVTHYVGIHSTPLFGIPASGRLTYLRSGEFYRVEGGLIVEAKLIMDFPDLMRQGGYPPFPDDQGTEVLFPGPETHDGVFPPARHDMDAFATVERMFQGLHRFDPNTFDSQGQMGPGGTWSDDFMWYGPGGIGSTMGWPGFVDHHRACFLRAFPDRIGGNHYCRFSDGAYVAVSGWPSMTMTHADTYLGIPPTGKKLTLRVMDFYRCEGDRIMENWVLLDYADLARQMGRDLF
ncbi:MAG: ester cyclase, partial [Pseudomonadota bacterium]